MGASLVPAALTCCKKFRLLSRLLTAENQKYYIHIRTSVLQQLAVADAFFGQLSYTYRLPTFIQWDMWECDMKAVYELALSTVVRTQHMISFWKFLKYGKIWTFEAPCTYLYINHYPSKLICTILTRSIFIHFDIISIPLCSINLFLFILDRIRITQKRKFLAFLKIIFFFFLFYLFTPIYRALLIIYYVDHDYPTKRGQRWSTTLLPA